MLGFQEFWNTVAISGLSASEFQDVGIFRMLGFQELRSTVAISGSSGL